MTKKSHCKVDAFIIGGGLAGLHLGLAMERSGMNPLVIGQYDRHSSSRIAAGIINPITGRRFALSWMYDQLEPVFTETYLYWENKWKARFFEPKNIYRSVPDNKLVNDLDAKLSDSAFQRHCYKMDPNTIKGLEESIDFKKPGYIMKGYQVNTSKFLDEAIHFLTKKGMYKEERYEMDSEVPESNQYTFQNYYSDKLIWATGASIVDNPWFKWVKMNPNKGEIIHLNTTGIPLQDIVKQSTFFIPISDNKLWMGSYNSWDFEDDQPTANGLDYLKSKAQILKPTYNISAHLSAIRPTVEDRRPVIGVHPNLPNIFLFNGFGSKGTSLIPYFAQNLVDHITKGVDIHSEADIKRFWSN